MWLNKYTVDYTNTLVFELSYKNICIKLTSFFLFFSFYKLKMSKILNYGSVNIDEFFFVPHICQSGETLSSTEYVVRAGGKGE